ncbi:hypothetical protein SLA2020_486280 [Shorea laevis]
MELLNPPIPKTPWIFSSTSFFTSPFSLNTCGKIKARRFRISKSPHAPLMLSTPQAFRVSAHFGRPTSRRNSLRKKLLQDQKVRQNPIPLDSSSDFETREDGSDDVKNFQESLNYASPRESSVVSGEASSVQNVEMKSFGGSLLLTKLENWIEQYKRDIEFWGVGSGPIFTVLQDLEGKVKQVTVNEDEILERSDDGRHEFGELSEVNYKILYAKNLAREMEKGENVIPRNSSVAKFVVASEELSLVNAIQGVVLRPDFIPKLSVVGSLVLCGMAVLWTVKKLFSFRNKEVRRKIESREEKEMGKGSVEVIQEPSKPPNVYFQKPQLDKQELMNNILKAKAARDALELPDSSSSHASKSTDYDHKIQEIRVMARQAREIESRDTSLAGKDEKELETLDGGLPNEMEVIQKEKNEDVSSQNNLLHEKARQTIDENAAVVSTTIPVSEGDDVQFQNGEASSESRVRQASVTSSVEAIEDMQSTTKNLKDAESTLPSMVKREVVHSSDTTDSKSYLVKNESTIVKPRVILSVKEAREFLSKKFNKHDLEPGPLVKAGEQSLSNLRLLCDEEAGVNSWQMLEADNQGFQSAITGRASEPASTINACQSSSLKDEEPVIEGNDIEDSNKGYRADVGQKSPVSNESPGNSAEKESEMDNWIEKNFHDVEPVLKKIGDGFRDKYMVARERAGENLNTSMEISQLGLNEDDSELEWMKDDRLREIVFQVRENELAGRDPFYLMDAEDKRAFFHGLEKKVEKENEKLSHLHEWLHSNIENLDYGADGVSLYDPPEKVVPRWKGPPLEKSPQFLDDFLEQRKTLFSEKAGVPCPTDKDGEQVLQKPVESLDDQNFAKSSADTDLLRESHMKDPKYSKTVIEGSDGSLRHGKKSGKEYWQHTKKWSRGFLESYNAETDPEIKSTMKDIGKDLDRWITEKEIEEAKDLMTKIPEKQKKFFEKTINKLKREMELFGPQAVVSKYREYAEEKEEDFLWWLDLPHVLCIELYTTQSEEQRIGFYALEMAADLELEPKPHHVIAFEDAGDCRNLCYIIQAHLDMLGNGHTFVVPRPPKDAFREAKANGFGVTVIRKGELKLNVDQTLEEVEEEICEIGSKMYHDKIMQERSVDVNTMIKGVFRSSSKPDKPTRRKRSKKMLKGGTRKQR